MALGALKRPDSVYHWARGAIRLARNRQHRFRASHFDSPVDTPNSACLRLELPTPLSTVELDNISVEYRGLRDQVCRLYRPGTSGRTPSVITEQDALVLYALVRGLRPTHVVETGVSDGMSSTMILHGLAANDHGSLTSVDFPLVGLPRLYGQRPGWIVPLGLQNRWHLLLGSSAKTLPPLLRLQPRIDMFLHDSEHSMENMSWEFAVAIEHLTTGGLLLADDALANDAFLELVAGAAWGERWTITSDGMGLLRTGKQA